MTTPQFNSPDGTLREELAFSTTLGSRFLSGVVSDDAIDIEVSIRGGSFTNDPDLVLFDAGRFTVPNPSAFPDGLDLVAGDNEVQVRAVFLAGKSNIATATVRFIEEFDGIDALPPTGIVIEQMKDAVNLTVEGPVPNGSTPEISNVSGFHFYASTTEGGGEDGYTRINTNLVSDFTEQANFVPLATLPVEFEREEGDPIFVRVISTQEDVDRNTLTTDVDERVQVDGTVESLRLDLNLAQIETRRFYSFMHNRSASTSSTPPTIFNGTFSALNAGEPLYYVITAVYFDPATNTEVESSFSAEVQGMPTEISSDIGSFPVVDRATMLRDLSTSIFRSNPEAQIQPGSVLRDTVLDPYTAEGERMRFIVDFVYRASSFGTLLAIDDPSGTGDSVAVSESSYKQALGQALFLTSDVAVQNVVDRAFEKQASNFGVTRLPGTQARGEVTFFLNRRPTRTFNIPLGTILSGGPQSFRTLRAASIPFENSAAFFDPSSGRYLVRVPVQAVNTGFESNLERGQISGVAAGLNYINESKTFGGKPQETNRELSVRAQNRLSSVDAGTERGYYQTAIETPGVITVNVIEAGDELMQRDYDPVDKIHRGGKVDVWVQGVSDGTVSDTFAFTFESARDRQFVLVGDPAALQFRSTDPNLSTTNPLVEMLDRSDLGLGLRNISTGEEFDLTGVAVTAFDTIQLDTSIPQPAVDLTDVVLGDYRYRTGESFVFTRQPVSAINSVVGENTGTLAATEYTLNRPEPLLALGRSTQAGDFLQISESVAGAASFDTPIVVTSEEHVLTAENPEFLDRLGGNSLTVRVFNSDRTVEYAGPFDPSGVSDYTIIEGGQTQAIAVRRVSGSSIASGQTVLVDYEHGENFTVRYTTNLIVSAVQDEYAAMRHTTADVLAKEAVRTPVDITATVVLERGASRSTVDRLVREALTNFINKLRTDNPLRLSDVIAVIEEVKGVSHVIQPLTKMVKGEGSIIVREGITSDQVGDYFLVADWSTPTVGVWLLRDELSSATTTGGGTATDFRGVFADDDLLSLQTVAPESLGSSVNQSYIIGAEGLSIPGFSDDTTLTSEGFLTSASRQAERVSRTANRVLVSIIFGSGPTDAEYSVTYIVGPDEGASDLDAGPAEYLVPGTFLFTYDEAREDSLRRSS